MNHQPSQEEIQSTLSAAGSAHHEYESVYLNGERDEQWAGWYAAYTLGRLGDFTTPSQLTQWLEAASGDGDWADFTAEFVANKLGAT